MSRANRLLIARPCDTDWEALTGDERTRYCSACGKNVFNVSAMSQREVDVLLATSEALPCTRGICDANGLLLTAGRLAAVTRRTFTVVLAAFPLSAFAQVEKSGARITGVVTDTTGTGIRNALVTLSGLQGNTQETRAGENGHFELPDIPPGTYSLRAESPGFASFRVDRLAVKTEVFRVSIQLQVGSVGGPAGSPELEPVRAKRTLPARLKLTSP